MPPMSNTAPTMTGDSIALLAGQEECVSVCLCVSVYMQVYVHASVSVHQYQNVNSITSVFDSNNMTPSSKNQDAVLHISVQTKQK